MATGHRHSNVNSLNFEGLEVDEFEEAYKNSPQEIDARRGWGGGGWGGVGMEHFGLIYEFKSGIKSCFHACVLPKSCFEFYIRLLNVLPRKKQIL